MKTFNSFSFDEDVFEKAFLEFDENRFFQKLEKKLAPKPYFKKYKGFKNLILALSYFFNLISAITASYLVIKWGFGS